MDSLLNRYFFRVIGENPNNLNKYSIETIRRNLTLGRLIHIPIVLWIVIGYVLSTDVIGLSIIPAIFISIFSGIFIYFIDFSVINSPKSKKTFFLRMLVGCIIALLGALILDVYIFEKDINEEEKFFQALRLNVDLHI